MKLGMEFHKDWELYKNKLDCYTTIREGNKFAVVGVDPIKSDSSYNHRSHQLSEDLEK